MTTAMTPTYLEVTTDNAAQTLQDASERLGSDDEVMLDFTRVARLDTAAIRGFEALARTAEEKGAKITLRAVNVEVYKVLKLARLASRFSFEQ